MTQNGIKLFEKLDLFNSVVHGGSSGGGSGGGGNSNTTVQKSDPWSGQQPYLTDTFSQAQNLYNGPGPQYYSGTTQGVGGVGSISGTVAPLSADTNSYINKAANFANNDTATNNAGSMLNQYTTGTYADGNNPYMQGMYNQVAQQVKPQTDAAFEQSNRYGSGAASNATATALANADANLAYTDFNNQQQNQLKAASLAPGVSAQQTADINQLNNAGAVVDNQNQALINANVAQSNYNQQLPYEKLNQYAAITNNGSYGSSTMGSQQQQMYRSPISSAAGGGLAGAVVGNQIWGGTGGALGGILGAAAGYAG